VAIISSGQKKLYVDCDGTVLGRQLDLEFRNSCLVNGLPSTYHWYINQSMSILPRRVGVLLVLTVMSVLCRIELVLWTNRFSINMPATKKNLGVWWHVFEKHMFQCATKADDIPDDGLIVDNEQHYIDRATYGYCIKHYL